LVEFAQFYLSLNLTSSKNVTILKSAKALMYYMRDEDEGN